MRKVLLVLSGLVFITGQVMAQKTITGKVTDENGNPIANASVQVKGSSTGTVARSDGSYTLTVPSNARTLVFSAINMAEQEIDIGSQSVVNVSLKTEEKALQEVVVTGYQI